MLPHAVHATLSVFRNKFYKYIAPSARRRSDDVVDGYANALRGVMWVNATAQSARHELIVRCVCGTAKKVMESMNEYRLYWWRWLNMCQSALADKCSGRFEIVGRAPPQERIDLRNIERKTCQCKCVAFECVPAWRVHSEFRRRWPRVACRTYYKTCTNTIYFGVVVLEMPRALRTHAAIVRSRS